MAKINQVKLIRGISIFLSLSYVIGAPYTMVLEYNDQLFSQRFSYPPEFIYLTCIVQFLCAIGILFRPLARWSSAMLSVITLGAIFTHFRMGSPINAIPALLYSVLQIWVALKSPKFRASSTKETWLLFSKNKWPAAFGRKQPVAISDNQ